MLKIQNQQLQLTNVSSTTTTQTLQHAIPDQASN